MSEEILSKIEALHDYRKFTLKLLVEADLDWISFMELAFRVYGKDKIKYAISNLDILAKQGLVMFDVRHGRIWQVHTFEEVKEYFKKIISQEKEDWIYNTHIKNS